MYRLIKNALNTVHPGTRGSNGLKLFFKLLHFLGQCPFPLFNVLFYSRGNLCCRFEGAGEDPYIPFFPDVPKSVNHHPIKSPSIIFLESLLGFLPTTGADG
jgi:hypothetical protein